MTIPVSKDFQFRFVPTRPRHQHVLELVTPHIPTITLGILSLNLLQWYCKTRTHRITDLLAYVTCLILHNLSRPLLSLCLAIAYTTWESLPGSIASLDLPSHAQFLEQTTFQPPAQSDEGKCIVCWDEEVLLGRLPCKHTVCKNCLESMGLAIQTACPFCKQPLFSFHDRLIFCISKGYMSMQAVTSILHLLVLYDEVQHYKYVNIVLKMALLMFLSYMLAKGYIPLIKSEGENWWRPSPKGGMRTIGLTFVMSAGVLCQTLYFNRSVLL